MPKAPEEIAPGVAHLPVNIANVYFVGAPHGRWALIDAAVPGYANKILEAAEQRYGPGTRPEAILLTHGHFDHAGSAPSLAEIWDVPVYAHPLELPYLTGQSRYPDPDPTAPGFMAFLSRFFPARTVNLGRRVLPLEAGDIPGMPGWIWSHTPGHAPGHVTFFRPGDRTLLAGDAFTTVNLDNVFDVALKRKQICRPPTPFTYDWGAARESVELLASLHPSLVACGHGNPMQGAAMIQGLSALAENFPVPAHGRYVPEPARAGRNGIEYLPPAPPDRAPAIAVAVGVAALAGTMVAVAARRRGQSNLRTPELTS